MVVRMAAKSKRFDLRTTPEFYDEVKAKAAELGVSVNDYVEQAVKAQVDGVRQGAVQDSSAQLDRIEANMEVLYHGMVAMAQRQELSMAAQAATMEAVRVLGGQVNEMGKVMERHALPGPERQAPRLGPTEDALRRKWGDAAVDDYLRRTR